ncbi:hypothetical protein VOLCADRAFT_98467 [Volvox carteri f. nagariensis]|uniref:Uncharacterized protein n=1 Tax=Volvox carteri f. nagariensis TaxID=3068 RepID=D8UFE8_VOLCA|nr:uncharacterized protein VOLCADRAFT_98467 [Volvox carteri f. nagariensis]EFJ41600.1 hypothetical protein VOLCADRAFT_98467 [Volvox carteri f. nagariensis]|eukprot:XP_002957391.1 hypothetical protein VOLCADRAFT_98467 [Volvox carteri f. nagariensis]
MSRRRSSLPCAVDVNPGEETAETFVSLKLGKISTALREHEAGYMAGYMSGYMPARRRQPTSLTIKISFTASRPLPSMLCGNFLKVSCMVHAVHASIPSTRRRTESGRDQGPNAPDHYDYCNTYYRCFYFIGLVSSRQLMTKKAHKPSWKPYSQRTSDYQRLLILCLLERPETLSNPDVGIQHVGWSKFPARYCLTRMCMYSNSAHHSNGSMFP